MIYGMICLLTEFGLSPSGSSTVHIYTQNGTIQIIHRTTQQFGRVRTVPRLGELYPGIYLTTEEKPQKNLSQCSLV